MNALFLRCGPCAGLGVLAIVGLPGTAAEISNTAPPAPRAAAVLTGTVSGITAEPGPCAARAVAGGTASTV